jgi:hypothetical protein
MMCLADGTPVGSFTGSIAAAADRSPHDLRCDGMDRTSTVAFRGCRSRRRGDGPAGADGGTLSPCLGVGRHLLGSQIFDYWRDPWGQKHEHYADGDLFDAAQPAGYHLMDRSGLYQWGPDLPDDFIDTRMTLGRLWRVLKLAIKDKARVKLLTALKNSMAAPGRRWQR